MKKNHSKRSTRRAAPRKPRENKHAGCVAVPADYWERIIAKFERAKGLCDYSDADGALSLAYELEQLRADIVAMCIGRVRL